jgi:hypothetical protein
VLTSSANVSLNNSKGRRAKAKKFTNFLAEFKDCEKKIIMLSQEQKDLLVGSLLGDGNLSSATQGRTWRYRALQKKDHEEYITYKYELLRNLCTTGLINSIITDKRTGVVSKRLYFNTCVNPVFYSYGAMFYTYDAISRKFYKDIPLNVEDVLTPRAVAILYQDDGALKWKGHSNAMRICTDSFSEAGVNRLKAAYHSRYNISTSLSTKKNNGQRSSPLLRCGVITGYRLFIPESSSAAFRNLILPYIIPCMLYKVS